MKNKGPKARRPAEPYCVFGRGTSVGGDQFKRSLFPAFGVCGWSTVGIEPRNSDDCDGRLSIRESAFLDMAQSENRSQAALLIAPPFRLPSCARVMTPDKEHVSMSEETIRCGIPEFGISGLEIGIE